MPRVNQRALELELVAESIAISLVTCVLWLTQSFAIAVRASVVSWVGLFSVRVVGQPLACSRGRQTKCAQLNDLGAHIKDVGTPINELGTQIADLHTKINELGTRIS